jgi:hypothetical protein
MTPPPTARRRIATALTLMAVVSLAAALRLGRLDEMEYKADEQWTYERATRIPSQEPWPLIGMTSSIGLPNPGLSVLLFVGLAKVRAIRSPVDLAASVAALNVAGLVLVFLFAAWFVGDEEREAWQWGGALAAVSPFAVLLQRKIWAQSALPLFSMLFLLGWWCRDRRWGALLWGFVGACLGQIHMSGFFFAAGFMLWELREARYRATRPAARWRWFMAGSLIGGIGVVVWVVKLVAALIAWLPTVVASGDLQAGGPPVPDLHIFSLWPSFWMNWFYDAAGLGLYYSLGPHYLAFLRGPIVLGHATWLALAATLASAAIAVVATASWTLGVVRDLRGRRLWSRLRACSETAFTEGAALGAFGLLLTVTCLPVDRHYLIVAYPLQWVWLSRMTLRRPRGHVLLAGLWIAQLAITLSFLGYIHTHQGAEGGDYGRGYRWQAESTSRP